LTGVVEDARGCAGDCLVQVGVRARRIREAKLMTLDVEVLENAAGERGSFEMLGEDAAVSTRGKDLG